MPSFSWLVGLATVIGLTGGFPLMTRNPYPATKSAPAFTLVANLTDESRDLSPSVQHYSLQSVRVGAGVSTAALAASRGTVFYQNGTDTTTGGVASDAGVYPSGISLAPFAGTADVHYVGINYGTAMAGLGIYPPSSVAWPALYASISGTFVVCTEPDPVYGRPENPVRFVESHVQEGEAVLQVPDGCAPIVLLAQCATLGDVPEGAYYDHASVQTVRCYEDVASIDWS